MNKFYAVPLIILFAFLILMTFTQAFIFRFISTDKSSYSSGENVTIRRAEYGIGQICSCMEPSMEIYRLQGNDWEKIGFSERSGYGFPPRAKCVDGNIVYEPFAWCDVVQCQFYVINQQWIYEWDMKFYSEIDGKKPCGNSTYAQYERIDAPKGMYKAKYGMTEAVFEIK